MKFRNFITNPMKAIALLVLLALPAYADDAPTLCLEPAQRVELAKHIVTIEAENASLKDSAKAQLPGWAIVVIAVAGVVVGGAVGFGVARATSK